jgi:hypothetical protein
MDFIGKGNVGPFLNMERTTERKQAYRVFIGNVKCYYPAGLDSTTFDFIDDSPSLTFRITCDKVDKILNTIQVAKVVEEINVPPGVPTLGDTSALKSEATQKALRSKV